MPNWCHNNVSVSHADPEMMEKFHRGVTHGTLFATLVPMPEALNGTTSPAPETNEELIRLYGADNWYTWNCDNWGTKWDVVDGDFTLQEDKLSGTGYFETAWSPPIQAYEKLSALGFEIDATYLEEGMAFAGRFRSDEGDESYEFDFSNENWREDISDAEVLELLESEYESWVQWQEEENEND